jgi:hypothetical protein
MDAATTIEPDAILDQPVSLVPIDSIVDTLADSAAQQIESNGGVAETPLVPVTVMPTEQEEINDLHHQIMGQGRTTLTNALHLGELLTAKKAPMKHGVWRDWVKANLDFDIRTAQNYAKLYNRRDEFLEKSESAAFLSLRDAYRMLAPASKKSKVPAGPDESDGGALIDVASVVVETVQTNGGPAAVVESPTVSAPEPITADLTAEQSMQVLDFISGVGIDPVLYGLLVAHGGIIRLNAAVQETPKLPLDSLVVTESPMEATNV